MRPRVGCRNFVSRLKQVVLPAPFGPMSAWMVPRSTRSATPFTAVKPANSFVRSSVSRIASPRNATDVPSPRYCLVFRGVRPHPRRDRDGYRHGYHRGATLTIRPMRAGGGLSRQLIGREWAGPKRGARPAVGGLPGGRVGSTRGVEGGGARVDQIWGSAVR